jgi:cell division protein ZapE
VLDLDSLIAALPARADTDELLRSFEPPPRFSGKRFSGYEPRHPSQRAAAERLTRLAREMNDAGAGGTLSRLRRRFRAAEGGSGIYLDGGFGVGKTHLLAALWHEAPFPKTYLSFDELMYFIGLVGVTAARAAFAGQRLTAVDEWELDDPGNLKLALAFLRGAFADGVRVVVTSNTLPLELGSGRFSQKDFLGEIEELSAAFEVVRIEGEDFRHRHFEADPGKEYFLSPGRLREEAEAAGSRALLVDFAALLDGLGRVHPIRFAGLVGHLEALFVNSVGSIERLPDALRWVHFVDTLYESAVPMRVASTVPLGSLFRPEFVAGPYGKKLSRCLSRMEEMLGE